MTPRLQRRFETLSKKRKKRLLQAEALCRKLRMGEVPWIRTLQASMDCIQLWRTVLSRKSGIRVSTRFISRLERRNAITNSLRYTKVQVKTKLNLAYKNYYELKKNASQLRETWLKDLAAKKLKRW